MAYLHFDEIIQFQEEFEVLSDSLFKFVLDLQTFEETRGFLTQKQTNALDNIYHACVEWLVRQHNKLDGFIY